MLGRLLEIFFVLILMFLVLANSKAFGTVVQSIGSVTVGVTKTLQGR